MRCSQAEVVTRVFALNPVERFRDLNMFITMPKVPVELQTSEDAEHLVKLLHSPLRQTMHTTHVLHFFVDICLLVSAFV